MTVAYAIIGALTWLVLAVLAILTLRRAVLADPNDERAARLREADRQRSAIRQLVLETYGVDLYHYQNPYRPITAADLRRLPGHPGRLPRPDAEDAA